MQGLRRRRDAVERLPGQHQFEPSRRKNTDIGVNNIQYTAVYNLSIPTSAGDDVKFDVSYAKGMTKNVIATSGG